MQTIGLIGTGIMGQGMARNLMRAGFSVQIYNRTRAKAAALEAEGALWRPSVAQCVSGVQAVITIDGEQAKVEFTVSEFMYIQPGDVFTFPDGKA